MATLVDGAFPNLTNWAARMDPNGSVAKVTNLVTTKRPELNDIPFFEGNLPTGHQITVSENSISPGAFRKINQGVAASKGDTAQYVESCCMLDAESVVDVALAKLNGNAAAFRSSENALKIEGLSRQMATALWYESVISNPERLHGLTPRYGGTSGYAASAYVKKPAAWTNSGTNCQSIWAVTWEDRKIYGIVPKGSTAGLQVEDKGELRVADPNDATKALYALVTKYSWQAGIAVEDYRYAARTQWDPDDSTVHADSAKTMYLALMDLLNMLYEVTPNTRIYMSRTTKAKMDAQLVSNNLDVFKSIEVGGRLVQSFQNVPIRVTDTLVGETAIS
jgi:hypothetical protein